LLGVHEPVLLATLPDVSETALIGPLSLAVKLRLLGTEDDPGRGGIELASMSSQRCSRLRGCEHVMIRGPREF
jgi:hypothetical protein